MGLRSSATGDGPGFPVVVFGGDHADVPLEPHAGRMLARALVEHGFSAIFDVGLLLTDDQIRFTSDFASELLRINRTALHLYIDEADTFAPQMIESKQQKLCLGTVSRLVKQGGIRGVGVTMISQRPADINKKVLSQVDILTVLRMSHPLDIAAATDWIKSEVSPEFAREVGDALPSLPVGTAFVCSASLGIGERIEVRARQTFNSGVTPAPGERKAEPKVLATVDIERLGREIADAAKRTQENSPEFLLKRIAELERAGQASGRVDTGPELTELRSEVSRLRPFAERVEGLEAELRDAEDAKQELVATLRGLAERFENGSAAVVRGAATEIPTQPSVAPPVPAAPLMAVSGTSPRKRTREHVKQGKPTSLSPGAISPAVAAPTNDGLTSSEQKVLDALASLEAVGVETPSKSQLSAFAGYSNPKSGGFAGPAAALARKGMMEAAGGRAGLTSAGRNAANKPARPATTKELQDRIFALLGEAGTQALDVAHRVLS